jgi:hypothetical protein
MSDAEKKVRGKWPEAFETEHDDMCKCCGTHCLIAIHDPASKTMLSDYKTEPEAAWEDAAHRLEQADEAFERIAEIFRTATPGTGD